MIRGSFRGFISGWPGVIMITVALIAVLTCFCCWCASIFYGRSKTRRRDEEIAIQNQRKLELDAQELHPISGGSEAWVPPTEPPPMGPCPYPTDPSLDGMPRPCL